MVLAKYLLKDAEEEEVAKRVVDCKERGRCVCVCVCVCLFTHTITNTHTHTYTHTHTHRLVVH